MKKLAVFLLLFCAGKCCIAQNAVNSISSPDKNIVVICDVAKAVYSVSYKGIPVIQNSKLGLVREDDDFSKNLELINVTDPVVVKDNYSMLNAKRKNISYIAVQRKFETKLSSGKKMNILFRVSNDGVAFQYEFTEKSADVKKITSEATSFHFNEGTRAWLQPKTEAQTGFEHTNPSYEGHYKIDIPTGTPAPGANGWVYPALFNYKDVWMLLTEAALGRTYCGTALQQYSEGNEYKINFPQVQEVFTNGTAISNPQSTLPWKTPWRIIAIGSMQTITESTLGTDLAFPAKKTDFSFVQPGKASWSWVLQKDDSTVYRVQKKFIDYAADMKWKYCLIDAEWDKKIGYDSVALLTDYARKKNIGILLWYNSAGSWNTVKMTPKDKLLTHESRVKEFSLLQKMGVKGIKVDFFAGDGQSMINYYQDILEDAAAYKLVVNFHGATLPRGLQRTYPNLITVEAVQGYEMITFNQNDANLYPQHATMVALVRNAFDPMDFTPMCLYKIPRIKKTTTAAFELATTVLFLSGIQHFAETPEGMVQVPSFVKNFLREIPDSWDDTKYVEAVPGKLYVVARKTNKGWYVAGINGEDKEKTLTLDLPFLNGKKGKSITTATAIKNEVSFAENEIEVSALGTLKINVNGNDGFVMLFK